MGKKVALLVGVGRCQGNNEKFPALQCPENGVAELEAILRNPEIGGFDQVESLVNPDLGTLQRCMGEFFTYPNVGKDDLVLLYFTGHGIKDMGGDFYLTTADTTFIGNRVNAGTAVPGSFVQGIFRNCYAQRKVIILDCCFGAAFAEGFLTMDDGSVDVEADLGGEGWVVLTAATARNYALEQEGELLSVYTRYLVEGLKTGAAADEGAQAITVRQLHGYVREKVQVAAPTMEPSIFNGHQGDGIALARAVINSELTYRQKVQTKIRRGRIAPAGRQFLQDWRQRLGIEQGRAAEIEAEVLKPFAEKQKHLDRYAQTLREEIEEEFPLSSEAIRDLKELQKLWNLRDVDVKPILIEVAKESGINVQQAQNAIDEVLHPLQQTNPQGAEVVKYSSLVNPPSNSTTPASVLDSKLVSVLKPEPKPSSVKTKPAPTVSTQPQPSQQVRRNSSSQPVNQINRRKLLTWAGWSGGGLIVFASARPVWQALTSPNLPEPVAVDLDNLPTKEFEVVTVNDSGEISDRQTKSASYFAEKLEEDLELVMMKIPGGKFLMGQPEAEKQVLIQQYGEDNYQNYFANELPHHQVNLSEFWIGQFQITQAQYQAVIGENPSNFSENGANRPVERVSWDNAVTFCEKLTQQTGQTYRLPSEAEWEYACRAGTTTPFHFGATITTDLVNYNGNSTTDVGSFPANVFGLYDMHGNVYEWCQDVWHSNYEGAPTDGSAWMAGGEQNRRVLRGGSWFTFPGNCRSAFRDPNSRGILDGNVGFRVVWVPA